MANFWHALTTPFSMLAPMEDVTDTVFRQIVASCARPDVFVTEFTNVDGMFSEGKEAVTHRLQFSKGEHPIVAQIWGLTPENYYKAAIEIADLGFDGIDINMGCPVKDVVHHGACSALINNEPLASEIIQATQKGARASARKLPVSVKTRIGFGKIETERWASFLLGFDLDALIVHGRTAAEQSKVPAHWDEIAKVVTMRDSMKKQTIIVGNGDCKDLAEAKAKHIEYGVDGIMIGRGIFDNPWAFDDSGAVHEQKERFALMRKHVLLFDKTWGSKKHFPIMKKFFKIYIQGFEGASDMRARFMEMRDSAEVISELDRLDRNLVR